MDAGLGEDFVQREKRRRRASFRAEGIKFGKGGAGRKGGDAEDEDGRQTHGNPGLLPEPIPALQRGKGPDASGSGAGRGALKADAAMARATASLLKHHNSSILPPPRATKITSGA